MDWHWTIFNFDPYVNYILKETGRWAADNAATILILSYLFAWFQNQAERLESVKDNKRLSLLGYYMVLFSRAVLYVLSFKWLTQFRSPKAEKDAVK